jgi:hypothetical protein
MPITRADVTTQQLVPVFDCLKEYPSIYQQLLAELGKLKDSGQIKDCTKPVQTILACAWLGRHKYEVGQAYIHQQTTGVKADTWITEQVGLTAEGGLAAIADTIDGQLAELFQKAQEQSKLLGFFTALGNSDPCLNGRVGKVIEFSAELAGISQDLLSDATPDSKLSNSILGALYALQEADEKEFDPDKKAEPGFRQKFRDKIQQGQAEGKFANINLNDVNFHSCFNAALAGWF